MPAHMNGRSKHGSHIKTIVIDPPRAVSNTEYRLVSWIFVLFVWTLVFQCHIFPYFGRLFDVLYGLVNGAAFWYIIICRLREKKTPDDKSPSHNPSSKPTNGTAAKSTNGSAANSDQLPFISILIPSRNESRVLTRLVESVGASDYPKTRLEMIVVDDCSSDSTPQIVQELASQGQRTWLRTVRRQQNGGGKSGCMNWGYSHINSQANIVGYLDADAVVRPDVFLTVAKTFQNDSNIAAIQAPKCINPSFCFGGMQKLQFWEMLLDSMLHSSRLSGGGLPDLHGNGEFVRRELLDALGGSEAWNEQSLTDDLDMTFRLCFMGYKVTWLADTFAVMEEPVYTWVQYFDQRRRWATGGFQRFLDYWRYVLFLPWQRPQSLKAAQGSSSEPIREATFMRRVDLLFIFSIQYFFSTMIIPDYVFGYWLGTPSILTSMEAVMSSSIVALCALTYQRARSVGRWRFGFFWFVISPIFSSLLALVVAFVVLDNLIHPRALTYEKGARASDVTSPKPSHGPSLKQYVGAVLVVLGLAWWTVFLLKLFGLHHLGPISLV